MGGAALRGAAGSHAIRAARQAALGGPPGSAGGCIGSILEPLPVQRYPWPHAAALLSRPRLHPADVPGLGPAAGPCPPAHDFNPDMTGWEDKAQVVTMPFVGKRDGLVHFDGMSFQVTGPDTLTCYLAIESKKDGTVREVTFTYRRVKP
ncbi:MAG: DUF6265 family protein [Vicinamibacteria bacterium]